MNIAKSCLAFIIFFCFVLFQFDCRTEEVYWAGNESSSKVALTFDDGPDKVITPVILAILKQFNAKATFFCVGANCLKHPELAKEIIKQGNEIGGHTYLHRNLVLLAPDFAEIVLQIGLAQKAIWYATG